MTERAAVLVLEDGRSFRGRAFGAAAGAIGELVFNTSMSGYQEILTDPSYAGQLVTLTSAQVGNYGISPHDMESERVQAAGLVVRQLTRHTSSWRATQSLDGWLAEHGVVGIEEVDTRALTRHLRSCGVMRAIIAEGEAARDVEGLRAQIQGAADYGAVDYVARVTCAQPMSVVQRGDAAAGELPPIALVPRDEQAPSGDGPHVVVVDFGVKASILRQLVARGARVSLVPASASAAQILAMGAQGVLLSNGPGDPARMDHALADVRALIEARPVYGICLGHQLLARALGGETFKLRFGHRGPNQPVKALDTGSVSMTSQNHGYAVSAEVVPEGLEVTHVNLNDGTIAGFRHPTRPVSAVQYHPEAGPGPHDGARFFDEFLERVRAQG